MYKAIETKKYRIQVETFNKSIRDITVAYNKGFVKFLSPEYFNYGFVFKNVRILFSIKRQQLSCCNK